MVTTNRKNALMLPFAAPADAMDEPSEEQERVPALPDLKKEDPDTLVDKTTKKCLQDLSSSFIHIAEPFVHHTWSSLQLGDTTMYIKKCFVGPGVYGGQLPTVLQ